MNKTITPFFIQDKTLEKLEKDNRPQEAVDHLYSLWRSDKNNDEALLRLIAECWYVAVEYLHEFENTGVSYEICRDRLIESTEHGLQRNKNDWKFDTIVGFMMGMFPWYFTKNDKEITSLEKLGRELIKKHADQNRIAACLLYGFSPYSSEKKQTEYIDLAPLLPALFPGKTWIEEYFKEFLELAIGVR